MELALNLLWLGVVMTGFVLVPKRRSRLVWFALIAASALLFPIISLSDEWTDHEENHGNRKIDLLEDDNPSGHPLHEIQLRDIRDVIAGHLSEKERIIVTLYYYEGLSMKEIAKVLNLTESRICQIHGKVVERLKEQLVRAKANLFI